MFTIVPGILRASLNMGYHRDITNNTSRYNPQADKLNKQKLTIKWQSTGEIQRWDFFWIPKWLPHHRWNRCVFQFGNTDKLTIAVGGLKHVLFLRHWRIHNLVAWFSQLLDSFGIKHCKGMNGLRHSYHSPGSIETGLVLHPFIE